MLYFRRVLVHLVEIGDEMAEMVRQEARANAAAATREPDPQTALAPAPQTNLADAYERITRSIRRSIMLYQKLAEPQKILSEPYRIAARKKLIRDVEDAIQANAEPGDEEKLHAEFLDRLDRPDLENEIADRPIADIVTDMCRDLGIGGLRGSHPWKRRVPHDIAILNARAEQLAGVPPSAELQALIAAAPPKPPGRITPDIPADLSKIPDAELDALIEATRRYADP